MSQGKNEELNWDALLTSLYEDVFRRALSLCGSRVLAEDLAQETFLRAWRFHHTLRDPGAARAWLLTILRNEVNRGHDRFHATHQNIDDISLKSSLEYDPDERAERDLLRNAISELGSAYREPLMMQVFDGLSGKEISAKLNLNENTVMTRLFRARAKLIRKFELEP